MTKQMILQTKDINTLKEWGYSNKDIKQIQEAIDVTEYTKHELVPPYKDVKKLTAAEAYRLLGNKQFLSGISRSAFHWSASREYCKKYGVSFDSSKLFE